MYNFIKEFFKFLSHINKTHKIYYASYAAALIFATTLNMSLTYFYGKLIDSMTAKASFSRFIWVYGGILFGTFIFFRAWSVINIFIRNKAREIIYRKTFAASLRTYNDDNAVFSQDIENASQLFLDFVYTLPSGIISFLVVFAFLVVHSQFIMLFYLGSFTLFFNRLVRKR